VQPGSWHRWWNPGRSEVRIRTRIEPALRFEEMIAILWGLCADGRTNAKGVPSPLGALLATRYREEIRFRQPPQLVQRLLLPPLARRRGLDRLVERYLDPATHPSAQAGLGRLRDRIMTGAPKR
jgi:hypothetical protein